MFLGKGVLARLFCVNHGFDALNSVKCFCIALLLCAFFLPVSSAGAQPTPPPTNLTAENQFGKVVLNWSSDTNLQHRIYRSTNNGPFNWVGTTNTGLTWTDNANYNGTTYAYYVTAIGAGGASSPSNTVSILVQIDAVSLSIQMKPNAIILRWTPAPQASGQYTVYISTNGSGFTPHYATTNGVLTYTNTDFNAALVYGFYVVGRNFAGGVGLPSNKVYTTVTPAAPGTAQPTWQCACPKIQPPAAQFSSSTLKPDPINVATGGESNEPDPDLVVYNPAGPAVAFQRMWRANQVKRGYGSPGLAVGWVHNYDYVMEAPETLTSWADPFTFTSPNGAVETITPQVDGGGQPTGNFTTSNGAPYFVTGVPGTQTGKWNSITVTWADRSKWTFSPQIGRNYIPTLITNRMGKSIQLTYWGTRHLAQIKRADTGANLLSFEYGGNVTITRITDIYGRKVNFGYTTPSGMNTEVISTVSQVGTASSLPMRWTYTYQYLNYQPFLWKTTVPSPTGTGTVTGTINYDPTTLKVSSIVDANGNQTVFTYNTSSTTIAIKDAGGNTVLAYAQKFDADKRSTGIIDALGNESTIEYNDPANPRRPTRVIDPLLRQTNYTYDAYGNVLTITDPRNTVTTFTYDYNVFPLGRLTSVQQGTKPATTVAYFEPTGLVQSVTGPAPAGSGVSTVTSSFTYDTLGNVLTVTGPGNNAASTITTTLNYTTDGAYSQTAAIGQPLRVIDNLGHTSRFRYDSQGRTTNAWDALNNEVRFTYNVIGQTLTASVPATGQSGAGRGYTENTYLYVGGPVTATKVYNETGTLVRTTNFTYGLEGEPLSASGATEPFSQVYDAAYRVVSLSDGNSNATTYAFDSAGRLSGITYPGGDTVSFPEYFADGALKKRIDGNGAVTNFTYSDPEGLLTAVSYPATPGRNVSFTYDSVYGRLMSRTDGTGTQTYTYGDLDEVTGVTTTYTFLPSKTLSYAYFPDGSRQSLTTPVGSFTYLYDGKGRPTSLTNPYSETTSWTYQSNNWLASQVAANGHSAIYTYNALGQLTDLLNRLGVSTTLSQFNGMVHDGAGNRLSATANIPSLPALSGNLTYGYDSKDQVTGETRTGGSAFSTTFGYDNAGNPTTFKGFTRTFNVKNQLTGGTGLGTFTYDGNGNPTVYNGTTATYDAENHLTSWGTALTAEYNADGLRAWKQNSAGTRTYFLYDGLIPIIEMDASGNAKFVNTIGENGLVSRRDVGAGTSVFYTFDERGNTTQRLDAAGVVLSSRIYDSFGVGLGAPPFSGDPYDGFGAQVGYYTDVETGLVLCTLRYYDPTLGRWLTRDPIGYSGGVNLYGYVTNNPMRRIDPLGLDGDGVWGWFIGVGKSVGQALSGANEWVGRTFRQAFANKPLTPGTAKLQSGAKGNAPLMRSLRDGDDDGIFSAPTSQEALGKGSRKVGRACDELTGIVIIGSLQSMSNAGRVMDRNNLTKAGRALQKHGSRPGSLFPAVTGKAADLNRIGQEIVDDILTYPGKTTSTYRHRIYGIITDIRAPDGRGLRYNAAGELMGFLD